MKPIIQTFGSLSANFNGNSWICDQISASVAGINDKNSLQIHVQNENIEYVLIRINEFKGKGMYAFDENVSIKVIHKGKRYWDNPKFSGAWGGTIEITSYIPKSSKKGKIIGEFSGTLKDVRGNSLTISNGKFKSIII